MKTTIFANKVSIFTRFGRPLSFGIALGLALAGLECNEGAEGDRCNPDLSHNECNSGLICTAATDLCPENYCCPADGNSSNPNCQPGCNGGAAAICFADPTATYACEVADAQAHDTPLPPEPAEGGTDATTPDAGTDGEESDGGADAQESDGGADAQEDAPDGD